MLVTSACRNFLVVCEKNKNLSRNTLKAYSIDLEQFIISLNASIEIEQVLKQHILDFQGFLISRGCCSASIKRKLACVKAMFRWYELLGVLEINVFHKLDMKFKAVRRLPRNIPTDDIKRLISAARKELGTLNSSEYCFAELISKITCKQELNKLTALSSLELLLCTGIRVGELVGIKLDDIDIFGRRIRISGKGMKERVVFLPDKGMCHLINACLHSRQITGCDHNNFLVNSRGKSASTQFIRMLIRRVAEKAKVSRKITPHMCRHSAACQLLEEGIDIRYVQRLLGHQSISTTEIYTYVSDRILQEKITTANIRRRF